MMLPDSQEPCCDIAAISIIVTQLRVKRVFMFQDSRIQFPEALSAACNAF